MCATKGLWDCGLSDGFTATGDPSLYFCGKCWRGWWVEELVWVCWLVGLRINGDGWSEFHFSQSDEFCCKIHDVFSPCFKEADH